MSPLLTMQLFKRMSINLIRMQIKIGKNRNATGLNYLSECTLNYVKLKLLINLKQSYKSILNANCLPDFFIVRYGCLIIIFH